jgi:hypothetical protein
MKRWDAATTPVRKLTPRTDLEGVTKNTRPVRRLSVTNAQDFLEMNLIRAAAESP